MKLKELRTVTRRRLTRFAFIFALVFSLTSIAQILFVRRQVLDETTKELDSSASQISREIAYQSTWDLAGYRQSLIQAPNCYVCTVDGLAIDIEGFIADFPVFVDVPASISPTAPQMFNTQAGEKWHRYYKKVEGGWVFLGVLDIPEISAPNKLLLENASRFGSTLEEALRVEPREINWNVDYAIADNSGLLRFAAGGVPLTISHHPFARLSTGGSLVRVNGHTYLIFVK